MGKMSLGLDDRSARLIHGRDVWTQIKDLLSGYSNIQAAIAFVGADADQYLALRGPATIVVNAGDEALRDGSTNPEVLLRWTRRGVRVYSLRTLHAKVILAEGNPSFVLVGSADVLSASGRSRDEAVLVADERETVDELRHVVTEWRRRAGEPLSEAWLQAATSRYRPAAPHRLIEVRSAAPERAARPLPVAAAPPIRHPAPAPAAAALAPAAAAPAPPPAPLPVAAPPAPAAVPAAAALAPAAAAPAAAVPPAPKPPAPPPPAVAAAAPPLVTGAEPGALPEPQSPPRLPQPAEVQPTSEPVGVPLPAGVPVLEAIAAPVTSADPPLAGPEATPDARPATPEAPSAQLVEHTDNGAPATDLGPPPVVPWPRPKYIYLATLTRDGRASDSALERLEQLRSEFRVPAGAREPVLDVEMFWWDEQTRSSGRPTANYREGWHLVPISVPVSGRPAVLSAVDSPGRVLHSFTEYVGGPARTYYYLLQHSAGPSTTFRKLREALMAVGEKPSYDHAYMMQHKVAAILDLWPEITYTD